MLVTLKRVLEDLDQAARLLNEVYTTGLWVKSDDCSDNRRKRQGLREADWTVSGAVRKIAEVRIGHPDVQPDLLSLETRLEALVAFLKPLPEMVIDTMGDNAYLDDRIRAALAEVSNLQSVSESVIKLSMD